MNKKIVPINADFIEMLLCARRYAFGRQTYVVSDVVNYITPLLQYFDDNSLSVMKNDLSIDFEFYSRVEKNVPDAEVWKRLQVSVDNEIAKRNEV